MNGNRVLGYGSYLLAVVYVYQIVWIDHGCPWSSKCVTDPEQIALVYTALY